MISKLALGSAQFGMDYGIAGNKIVSTNDVKSILDFSYNLGINTIDTAFNYGKSESVLGKNNLKKWKIITKLPLIDIKKKDIKECIYDYFFISMKRLNLKTLYGILLHFPDQLKSKFGQDIYASLNLLRNEGLVKKIGISIYDPNELNFFIDNYNFDIVQAPLNIFDDRIISTGWLKKLYSNNIDFYARSIFLQGLLLIDKKNRPKKFLRWEKVFDEFDELTENTKKNKIYHCLNYVLNTQYVKKAIIGINSFTNLKEILLTKIDSDYEYKKLYNKVDKKLINPSLWK